jgi:hypothetical protein
MSRPSRHLLRLSRVGWSVLACSLLVCAVIGTVSVVQAADENEPQQRSEEIRQLESQMEELEKQLDAIYEKLDDYTVNSAPPEILEERHRIEQQLQQLHERRSRALRELHQPTATSRLRRDAPEPPREPARRKALANSLVKIGSDLVVRSDEIVNGDAIILGGNLRVEGEVLGDVVVLGGNLEIARSARVGGQALVVGGYLEEGRGAVIEGESLGLSFFPSEGGLRTGLSRGAMLILDGVIFLMLFVVAGWFVLLHRRRFGRALAYLESNTLRSFGLGILLLTAGSFILSVFAMLLLATFFGIPIALLMGMLMAALLLAALCVGTHQIGRRVVIGLRSGPTPRLLACLSGLFLILAPEVIGDLLSPINPWIDVALDAVSALLTLLAMSLGLGALVMTRMGRRVEETAPHGESPAAAVPATG